MTYSEDNLLTKAAVLAGGVDRLAYRLNVSADELLAWIAKESAPPAQALKSAAAIISAYDIDRAGTPKQLGAY